MPHPSDTDISVRYTTAKGSLKADITLPEALSSTHVYKGQQHPLHPGSNIITTKR